MKKLKILSIFSPAHPFMRTLGFATIAIVAFIGILSLIPEARYTDGFRKISEINEHAKTLDEFIKMEGKNYAFPIYESYYQAKFGPSIFRTLKNKFLSMLYFLHIKNPPLFSESFFTSILEDVSKYRTIKGWTGDFIQKINLRNDSKVVVFGSVQGAFHGLDRYLEKLKELNIIGEDLKIINSNNFIVFFGNVVNRSPYTLEIFSIVLKLLQQNPENVIYLRGPHEQPECWRQHTLRRELELRVKKYPSATIPLSTDVDIFFKTLPLTLYCTIPNFSDTENNAVNFFKISPRIDDTKLFDSINEESFFQFLSEEKRFNGGLVQSFFLKNISPEGNHPNSLNPVMCAYIREIRKRDKYEEMDGLRLLPPTNGITTWTVLSTACEPARLALNHHHEAFVIIESSQKPPNRWTISLFNRNVMNKDALFKHRAYDFFSGEPITDN